MKEYIEGPNSQGSHRLAEVKGFIPIGGNVQVDRICRINMANLPYTEKALAASSDRGKIRCKSSVILFV